MSVSITARADGINEALVRLNALARWRPHEGARRIAPIIESQTRRRIEVEKTTPEARAWKPNLAGTPILLRTGRNLRDSVAHRTAGADAIVEAHWQYAHVHQYGATIEPKSAATLAFTIGDKKVFARKVTIPARRFMGLSEENERELVVELNAMLADMGGRR